MKTNILHCLLLALLVAGPGSISARDSSFTGLGNVPSGMGLGTTPGGKLDRKQDLSVSRAEHKHEKKFRDFHHRQKHKPRFHGSGIRFQPHQIYIIQDPEARRQAPRYSETVHAESYNDSGDHDSFEQLRSDFSDSRSFEEIRAQFLTEQ